MRKLVADSAAMLARGPALARQRAAEARDYAVAHLEELHAQLKEAFAARGIGYYRVETAEEAVATVKRLLGDAKRVPKSKSMVAEEIGLTPALRAAGIDVLETDIGEYIVDIEGRGPSHITAPALHLNRGRIRELLERTGTTFPDDDPTRLSRFVRDAVGEFFADCDAAITGMNMAIASSGRMVIVENEGNVSLGVSHPKLHIAVTGLEKVVADEAAALAVLQVLAPSATAQPLTSFTHFLAGPDAGQQRHVVFVDNGRSRILADERFREVLKCIRCGACMNACPVYRVAGGLSYGAPYMGPIGAVVAPLLWPDGRYNDLPGASSLCGRCTEVCPVGIPLHRMLLDLRAEGVESGAASPVERAAWKSWMMAFTGSGTARLATSLARAGLLAVERLAPGLPVPAVSHAARYDADLLVPLSEAPTASQPAAGPEVPEDAVELFKLRAAELGIEVVSKFKAAKGDRELEAEAGIANTGSVLLTGANAARRPLLAAPRVVVKLDPKRIVRDPADLAPHLGDGDALLLTGASRTADIEKQIVRGIHGAEQLIVVLKS
jgi:L-lactate dehydrogenase complex protein LldF